MKRLSPAARPRRIAKTLPAIIKQRRIPGWVRQIIRQAASEHRVAMLLVLTASRKAEACRARYAAIYRVKHTRRRLSAKQIAYWFGRDHASIFFALARHAQVTGLPPLTRYSLRTSSDISQRKGA